MYLCICICLSIYLSIYVSMYLYIYVSMYLPWLSNDPLFLGSFKKKTCFSESTGFEIKYCFLHVGDGHSWRWAEAAENQEMRHIANLKLIVAGVILVLDDWRRRRKDFQSIGSRLCLMPRFRSSLLWFLGALCSFIFARMRVGLNTQLRTCGCIAQFWWQIFLGRFAQTMQTCKVQTSNVLFLCRGPSGRRPKVRKKASKVRKYPSSLDPSEPKDIVPFFHRSSVHLSKLCQQLAPQGQGEWMCSIPVCILQKCRNVQMFAPAAHCKKRAKVSYLDRNRGSKVVVPRSFSHTSHTPGPEMMCEVPDPTSGRTSTKRSHDLV